MKLLNAIALTILVVNSSLAQTTTTTNSPADNIGRVEKALADYSRGALAREDFYGDDQSSLRKEVISYFQRKKSTVTVEQKLLVAACMGKEGDFGNAAKLLEEYVQIYTNSADGWLMLGTAFAMTEDKQKAVEAYQKAVSLGSERALLPMVADAFDIKRLDIVTNNVPKLLELKKSNRPPKFIKLEIAGMLAMYAQASNNEDLFVEALEDVQVDDILQRKDIARTIAKICDKFNSQKAKDICEKLKLAQGKR